ncbi:TBC domain containing protein [Entamoeba marina]
MFRNFHQRHFSQRNQRKCHSVALNYSNRIRHSNPHSTNEQSEVVSLQKFIDLLSSDYIDKQKLIALSRNGVSPLIRYKVWKVVIGYIPLEQSKQENILQTKRTEYYTMSNKLLCEDLSSFEEKHLEQIKKDLIRSNRVIPFLFHNKVQRIMERVLLVWAIRHPASGYVQGMNDLIVPFLVVYLSEYTYGLYDQQLIDNLTEDELRGVEADTYWSFSWILQSIQCNYTFNQTGIHSQLSELEKITIKYNKTLHQHLQSEDVQYVQFAFRWLNCCLLREFPIHISLRLWDAYLSEPNGKGFQKLNIFCCYALLDQFNDQVMSMSSFDLLAYLQNLPTSGWTDDDIQTLLNNAYSCYVSEDHV